MCLYSHISFTPAGELEADRPCPCPLHSRATLAVKEGSSLQRVVVKDKGSFPSRIVVLQDSGAA